MNRIKNTLRLTSQLLLTAAVALLTQQVAQAQTNVNVVNTPTVRIDSRANEVKVVNSPSTPVPVRVIEEPLRLFVRQQNAPFTNACVELPLPPNRLVLIEQIDIVTRIGKVSNLTLGLSFTLEQGLINYEEMYDIPLNEKGNGQLQLKLYAKRFLNIFDAGMGDVTKVNLCYETIHSGPALSEIFVIATGRILPQ